MNEVGSHIIIKVNTDLSCSRIESFDTAEEAIFFLNKYIEKEYNLENKGYKVYQLANNRFKVCYPGYIYGNNTICQFEIIKD